MKNYAPWRFRAKLFLHCLLYFHRSTKQTNTVGHVIYTGCADCNRIFWRAYGGLYAVTTYDDNHKN